MRPLIPIRFVSCCLGLLLLWGADAGAQEVSDIRVHDPVVICEGDTYHLFCTGRGIAHFTSPDLQEWTESEPVFAEKPAWTDGVVADVVDHEGRYDLYYSVSALGKREQRPPLSFSLRATTTS